MRSALRAENPLLPGLLLKLLAASVKKIYARVGIRIITREACITVALVGSRRLGKPKHRRQAVDIEIAQGIRTDLLADLIDRVLTRDELIHRRNVGSVVAGEQERRRRDPYVNLKRTGLTEHTYDIRDRSTSYDGVIGHYDSLALYRRLDRIKLYSYGISTLRL